MSQLLIDTHILLHWLVGTKRLSRDQTRAIDAASRRGEPLGLSGLTLLEIAILFGLGKIKLHGSLDDFLEPLELAPYKIFPITADIALALGGFRQLKDPFDRAIAATARVHGLRLVTSDQRIIDSNLVSTVT